MISLGQPKSTTKKPIFWVLGAAVMLLGLAAAFYMFQLQYDAVAAESVIIEPIDFSSIHDGYYMGEYRLGWTTYEVEVKVSNRRIAGVEILRNRNSSQARQAAAEITARVVARGNVGVDLVSGATTSSTGILKAIEQALKHAPACPT